jgi:hypothetical protein
MQSVIRRRWADAPLAPLLIGHLAVLEHRGIRAPVTALKNHNVNRRPAEVTCEHEMEVRHGEIIPHVDRNPINRDCIFKIKNSAFLLLVPTR